MKLITSTLIRKTDNSKIIPNGIPTNEQAFIYSSQKKKMEFNNNFYTLKRPIIATVVLHANEQRKDIKNVAIHIPII